MRFEGITCTLRLERPRAKAVVLALTGIDTGELGRAPFDALEDALADGPIDLFIDTRDARAASASVTNAWALWMRKHDAKLASVTILARTRFLLASARLVREFANLGKRVRIVKELDEFDRAMRGAA